MLYYIERLTLRTWRDFVLPEARQHHAATGEWPTCHYVDSTQSGLLASRVSTPSANILSLARLDFRIRDVQDSQGLPLRLRLHHHDLTHFRDVVRGSANYLSLERWWRARSSAGEPGRLPEAILKSLTVASFTDASTVWRALFVLQAALWCQRKSREAQVSRMFLEARPWPEILGAYAEEQGLKVIFVPPSFQRREHLPPRSAARLRAVRNATSNFLGGDAGRTISEEASSLRWMTESWGYLNLDRHEKHSDLFFVEPSTLPANRLVLTFSLPGDPLDAERAALLGQHGIQPVATNPRARTANSVPLFTHWPEATAVLSPPVPEDAGTAAWIRRRCEEYSQRRQYWLELFRQKNVRLFTGWYRFDGAHCAMADALAELKGVFTLYQRSFQTEPSAETAAHADVLFGYSPMDAEVERQSGSTAAYHVAVGYLGDHRFPLLRAAALRTRAELQSKGVRYVVAFFDENSQTDERWHTGHPFQEENYAFLLEHLLADSTLGLVLKPKVPATLRQRLGATATLLDEALATGRCVLFDEGKIQGTYPPAAAALAADLAIHSHLSAATAGFESVLAGIPTLLLDRENWHCSRLYSLGVGKVVFPSWEALWSAVGEARCGASATSLGNWSPLLEELDPFRDGRAAERLGNYLHMLLEGLQQGMNRHAVMERAAERYARMWGSDKITEIRQETVLEA